MTCAWEDLRGAKQLGAGLGRPAESVQKDGALLVKVPGGLDKTMPVCIKAAFQKTKDS